MTQIENQDSIYGTYDTKLKDVEGILNQLKGVIDVSEHEITFQQIQSDAASDPSLAKDLFKGMDRDTFQKSYEEFSYSPYIKRLDDLNKTLQGLNPFYELKRLTEKINVQIAKITCDDIDGIIRDAKTLLDSINALTMHEHKDKQTLLDEAYEALYSAILHEELFERSDILAYLLFLNKPINRENLGRLLSKDLDKLDKADLIDADLKALGTEGLGYDFITYSVIKQISQKTIGEKNSEFQERKKQAVDTIASKVNFFLKTKNNLQAELNDTAARIKGIRFNRSLLFCRLLSVFCIPVATLVAARMIGRAISARTIEYKTITQTVDLETGAVIGEPIVSWESTETSYVATVMVCEPWQRKPVGSGYIQNITTYDYIVPENIPEDYHLTADDLLTGTLTQKYVYSDSKNSLDPEDNQTDIVILIAETFQDKATNRPSTRFVFPATLFGTSIGLIIDAILIYAGIYGYDKTRERLNELKKEAEEGKLNKKGIEERLKQMKAEALELQDECNDVMRSFSISTGDPMLTGIDPTWLEQSIIKRTRKNKPTKKTNK